MSQARTLAALAWRESRFARRRLFLFLSSISLGVAALVATQSFAANMATGVRDQARALLGADVALSARQPFGIHTEPLLDSLARAGTDVARVTSFASMATAPQTGGTRLAQVRAVEGGFPFYGEIQTRPAGRWDALQAGRNALVDPALLLAIGARIGDTLALGEARFRIAGTLERVPGDAGIASSFAPRVYIPARFLEETELLQFGSRVEYDAYLRFPDAAAGPVLIEQAERRLRADRVRARTAEDQQASLDEALGRLGDYLGLVGIFALLLGGIGVASAMGAYIAGKRETVATLRCLGATAPQILAIYLLQATVMGFAGAVLGAAIGAATQWVLPRLLAGFLPVEVRTSPDSTALLTGVAIGTLVSIGFALIPLLATRRISPLEALRRRVSTDPAAGTPRDYTVWGVALLLAGGITALVVLQAGDVRTGLGFAGGIAAALFGLWAAAWLVVRLTRRARGQRWGYPLRQGIANLHRPGNQTRTTVLALGFGVFLLATLYLAQENLLRPLRVDDVAARANLVLFDVQDDQAAPLDSLLRAEGAPLLQRAPIVPMRVAAINGEPVRLPSLEEPENDDSDQPEGWAVRREYRSTYRDTLVSSERLVEGTFGGAAGEPSVSLERDIAGDLGVEIGDRITWDVQGVQIPTRIGSIREVDWARLEPNFFAVFPSEVLRDAPQTWILLARASDAATRARVQTAAARRFANVATVDLTQVQAALDRVVGRVATTIRFLAGFSIATGFVVLLGAVAVGRLQRVRESVLLRTLGAARRQIAGILLTEYLVLGLLASVVGIGLAVGAGWALSRWVFELPFSLPVLPLLVLAAVVSFLAAVIGMGASREVFRHTPLEALREEG